MRTQVAIVGGGLGGLCTAPLLHAETVEFVLVEARDRLGGRILTVDDGGRPAEDGFDPGASWYWPQMQPAVAELGVPSFRQNSDGGVIFERMSPQMSQRYRGVMQEQQTFRLVAGTSSLVRARARGIAGRAVNEMLEKPGAGDRRG